MKPLPPPMTAAIDAPWCGATNGGRDTSAPDRGRTPEHRVDRRHLQGVRRLERRQQAGQPLGQHRLAGARRPDHEQVVPTCRGDLEREPRLVLARRRRAGRAAAAGSASGTPATTGSSSRHSARAQQPVAADQLGQAPRRQHPHPGHQRAPRRRCRPAPRPPRTPRRGRGQHGRQHPADGTHRAVQPELADVDHSAPRRSSRHQAGRRQHGDGDGQVEAAAGLGHRRRRQVDRQPPVGHRHARVGRGRLDPVGRLLARRIGQAADHELRQPLHEVRLDVDQGTVEPDQGHRPGAPQLHVATATRCSTLRRAGPGPQHADHVHPHVDHVAHLSGVLGQPARRQPPQPRRLAPGHRLDRVTEALPPAGLDLAHHEAVAVQGDDVHLTLGAPPVALQHLQPGVGQVARGQPLAVRPHLAGHLVRHPTRPAPSPHPDHLRRPIVAGRQVPATGRRCPACGRRDGSGPLWATA